MPNNSNYWRGECSSLLVALKGWEDLLSAAQTTTNQEKTRAKRVSKASEEAQQRVASQDVVIKDL